MRFLLDTPTFLWWLQDSRELSSLARRLLADVEHQVFWSAVSTLEIVLKAPTGKVGLPAPFDRYLSTKLEEQAVELLALEHRHAAFLSSLPTEPGDPFDRLLVAQALVEGLPLLSPDRRLAELGAERLW